MSANGRDDDETPVPAIRLGNAANVSFLAALSNLRTENKHHSEVLTVLYERLIDMVGPADMSWKLDVVHEMERHHTALGDRVVALKAATK